ESDGRCRFVSGGRFVGRSCGRLVPLAYPSSAGREAAWTTTPCRGRTNSMSLIEFEPDRSSHPVDLVEHIASINDCTFERHDADEISISVRGGWSDYHVSF